MLSPVVVRMQQYVGQMWATDSLKRPGPTDGVLPDALEARIAAYAPIIALGAQTVIRDSERAARSLRRPGIGGSDPTYPIL